MLHFFREVRVLREEGKLHKKLIFQIRMLSVVSLILAAVVVFNILFRAADPVVAGALAGIGFLLGLYVFSRMNVLNWNEEEEIIQTARMNMAGYITLALYIAFEIGLRTFLHDFSPVSTTAFLLAGIFGTLFGRVVGTIIEIHTVFKATHVVGGPK